MAESDSGKSSREPRRGDTLAWFITECRRIVKANRAFQRFMQKATGGEAPRAKRK